MTDTQKKSGSYFSGFGLKQVCDIILISASIVLVVGMFVEPVAVAIVGFALFIVGSSVSIVRGIMTLMRKISRTSPEFRNAVVNVIVMTIVFGLSIFGLVYHAIVVL